MIETSVSIDEHRSATGPSPVLFEMQGIRKEWRAARTPLLVLDDVALALPRGSTIWVGGDNGVGKTTLLRIAAGLIAPDAGTVRLEGLDPERSRRQFSQRVGFLSAGDRGLYPRLTVRSHLEMWVRLAFVPAKQRRPVVEGCLEPFGLVEIVERRVDRLSLGQRQRLRLALTFLHEPDLVLLDEPQNSLDTPGIEVLLGAVRRTAERGGAVIWCSPSGEVTHVEFDERFVLRSGALLSA